MDNRINEIYAEIRELEHRIKKDEFSTEQSIQSLRNAVDDLKSLTKDIQEKKTADHARLDNTLVGIDKDISVQGEKLSNIYYQLSHIERRIQKLEEEEGKSNDRMRGVIDRVLMAIIGGIITYLFSLLQ